jgi:hypothetical protein
MEFSQLSRRLALRRPASGLSGPPVTPLWNAPHVAPCRSMAGQAALNTGASSQRRPSACSLATCQEACAAPRTSAQVSGELPRTACQSPAMCCSTVPQVAPGYMLVATSPKMRARVRPSSNCGLTGNRCSWITMTALMLMTGEIQVGIPISIIKPAQPFSDRENE